MGPLATAGISALAYQHESRKQFTFVQSIVERIERIPTEDEGLRRSLDALADDLSAWVGRARATNALFDYPADAENTQTRRRFRAAAVLEDV